MSSASTSSGSRERHPAVPVLAAEFDKVSDSVKAGDGQFAPRYYILPSGEGIGRLQILGTVVDKANHGNEQAYRKLQVEMPDGLSVNVFASEQYEPQVESRFRDIEPPAFVSIVGKPELWEDDDGNTHSKVTAESVEIVDAEEVTAFAVEAAEATLDRLESDGSHQPIADGEYGDGDIAATRAGAKRALEYAAEKSGHADLIDEMEAEDSEDSSESDDSDDASGEQDGVSAERLEQEDYNTLRGFAAEFDDVDGNAGYDELVTALEGRQIPVIA